VKEEAALPRVQNLTNRVLQKFGLVMMRKVTHQKLNLALKESADAERKWRIFAAFPYDPRTFFSLLGAHKSQLGQDLLAVGVSQAKQNGFFVEFGATDGISLSNTHLLEKELGWTGILAEPGKNWHAALQSNRTAEIVKYAVWSQSGEKLSFLEASVPELSTLTSFIKSDHHIRKGRVYEVESISLMDLLEQKQAPFFIDFLSIDTEGSEFDILSSFDFKKYSFGLLCIEHNYSPQWEAVASLLQENGYERILSEVSLWDSWFVPKES